MKTELVRTFTELGSERACCLESSGQGTTVILCHSNSTASDLYRPLLEGPLGAAYHMVALDFPGHGKSAFSTRPAATYSLPALADRLADLVIQRGFQRYVLVGHSLGGHAILEGLDSLPGAAGIMLVSAPPIRHADLADTFRPDPTAGLLFAGALEPADVGRFASALVRPGELDPALADALRMTIACADPAFRTALGASLAAGRLRDEKAAAARARVPAVLVHGTEDPFIQATAFREASFGVPWRGGVVAFRAQGHSPHLGAPGEFERLLAAFLRECAARL